MLRGKRMTQTLKKKRQTNTGKEETLPLDLTGKLKKGFWARVGPVTKKKKKDLLREEEDQEEAEEEEWDELNGSGKRLALWKRLDKKQQLRNYAAFRLRLEYLDDYVERTFYSQQQLLRQQLRSEDSSRSLRQKNRAAKKNDTITTRSSTKYDPFIFVFFLPSSKTLTKKKKKKCFTKDDLKLQRGLEGFFRSRGAWIVDWNAGY